MYTTLRVKLLRLKSDFATLKSRDRLAALDQKLVQKEAVLRTHRRTLYYLSVCCAADQNAH